MENRQITLIELNDKLSKFCMLSQLNSKIEKRADVIKDVISCDIIYDDDKKAVPFPEFVENHILGNIATTDRYVYVGDLAKLVSDMRLELVDYDCFSNIDESSSIRKFFTQIVAGTDLPAYEYFMRKPTKSTYVAEKKSLARVQTEQLGKVFVSSVVTGIIAGKLTKMVIDH